MGWSREASVYVNIIQHLYSLVNSFSRSWGGLDSIDVYHNPSMILGRSVCSWRYFVDNPTVMLHLLRTIARFNTKDIAIGDEKRVSFF